jgi:hypothetical protein
MLQGKKTFAVSTRFDADSQPKNTTLTVVYDGCPESTALNLATQQLVVRVQGRWRKKSIPSDCTVYMKDYAAGSRHIVPMTTAEMKVVLVAEAMQDKAKRAQLLAELMALDEEDEGIDGPESGDEDDDTEVAA